MMGRSIQECGGESVSELSLPGKADAFVGSQKSVDLAFYSDYTHTMRLGALSP